MDNIKAGEVRWLAEAYKDYSETEYVLRFSKWFKTKVEAQKALRSQCQDLQHLNEYRSNGDGSFSKIF